MNKNQTAVAVHHSSFQLKAFRGRKRCVLLSSLTRIRLIHRRDLARDIGPLELAAQRLAAFLALEFLPLQELVSGSDILVSFRSQHGSPGSIEGLSNTYVKRR